MSGGETPFKSFFLWIQEKVLLLLNLTYKCMKKNGVSQTTGHGNQGKRMNIF